MRATKVHIKKFRHMKDLDINIGSNLTAISGQNGTGKSTILGMIGHIFDYKGGEKTKNNHDFSAKYGEIFRFCPENDVKSTHEYTVHLEDKAGNKIIRDAKSRFTKETKKTSDGGIKRGRFRIDVGDRHKKGIAAINMPVIYLGLKRLFPLASEKEGSIIIKDNQLTKNEIKLYDKYARDILILLERRISPQDIESPTKEFFAMQTKNYSYYGNSAGQDNLGQILTAILSFRYLKEKNKSSYKGGILLIDEVDATLYAGSQINLMKKLYKFSHDYNLQIIFTTHSLVILELLKEKKHWNNEINFFEVKNNKVRNLSNPNFSYIKDKILVQTARKEKINKTHVLCEDSVTEAWCKNLLNGTEVKKKLSVNKVPIGCDTLKELSKKNNPVFKKMVFVLDGDAKKDKAKYKRVVFLPGKMSPEKEMYNFLWGLDEEDDFWDNEIHFDKKVCFKNYLDPSGSDYKNWFKSKKEGFGNAYSRLFNRWKKENKTKKDEFVNSMQKIVFFIR
ncbi:MAG: AAA family ATPase [Candidatus Omnitrophica bacterium]|nr:AAA family ATPase [Candidatus Omnitrophota bacterium]